MNLKSISSYFVLTILLTAMLFLFGFSKGYKKVEGHWIVSKVDYKVPTDAHGFDSLYVCLYSNSWKNVSFDFNADGRVELLASANGRVEKTGICKYQFSENDNILTIQSSQALPKHDWINYKFKVENSSDDDIVILDNVLNDGRYSHIDDIKIYLVKVK